MGKMVPNHEMEWFFSMFPDHFPTKCSSGTADLTMSCRLFWADLRLSCPKLYSDDCCANCTATRNHNPSMRANKKHLRHQTNWIRIKTQISTASKKHILYIYILKHTYCIQLEPLTLSDIAAYVYILYNYYISIYIYTHNIGFEPYKSYGTCSNSGDVDSVDENEQF